MSVEAPLFAAIRRARDAAPGSGAARLALRDAAAPAALAAAVAVSSGDCLRPASERRAQARALLRVPAQAARAGDGRVPAALEEAAFVRRALRLALARIDATRASDAAAPAAAFAAELLVAASRLGHARIAAREAVHAERTERSKHDKHRG